MTEIRARVSPAYGAATRFVERPRIVGPLCVLDVQPAARRESLACAAIARRQNAVEHIYSTRDGFDQIFGRADAHKVPRRLFRHSWGDVFNHFKHHRLLFPDAQSADSVTVKANVYRLF